MLKTSEGNAQPLSLAAGEAPPRTNINLPGPSDEVGLSWKTRQQSSCHACSWHLLLNICTVIVFNPSIHEVLTAASQVVDKKQLKRYAGCLHVACSNQLEPNTLARHVC